MSTDQIIWLSIVVFLVAVLIALVFTWRSQKESVAKTARRRSIVSTPTFDAAAQRAKALEIFEGAELEMALKSVDLLEIELREERHDDAKLDQQNALDQQESFKIALTLGCAIVLGIIYALHKAISAS